MRLVIARCQVDYVGRLTAHLPSARRLLLVKSDGSVSVHADDRAYKPLNWMSRSCRTVETTEGETIKIVGIPNFAPEILRRVRLGDAMKAKKLKEALALLKQSHQLNSTLSGLAPVVRDNCNLGTTY